MVVMLPYHMPSPAARSAAPNAPRGSGLFPCMPTVHVASCHLCLWRLRRSISSLFALTARHGRRQLPDCPSTFSTCLRCALSACCFVYVAAAQAQQQTVSPDSSPRWRLHGWRLRVSWQLWQQQARLQRDTSSSGSSGRGLPVDRWGSCRSSAAGKMQEVQGVGICTALEVDCMHRGCCRYDCRQRKVLSGLGRE